MKPIRPLTADERETYAWQIELAGFGESAQQKLVGATALVSRCGGLGGAVALNLASAGIGRLILAHAGAIRPSDLNRQVLMRHDWLGRSRVECAAEQLRQYNPRLEVTAVPENISAANAERLVAEADVVFDCAPLFVERLAMNAACVRLGKPMIEAAVYGLEGQVTTIRPGQTPCLACLFPDEPPHWKRRFPVLGAVASLAGSIAAMEGIKVITGFGDTLAGDLLLLDAGSMNFRKVGISRRDDCPVCGKSV